MKVLVIAPHPDDEVLGCGGTIARYTSVREEVCLCVVTRAYPPEWPEDEIPRRKQEVLTANRILGIRKTDFLDFPAVKLDTISQKELADSISRVIDEIKPEVVYLPHRGDVNKDHRLVFEAAMVATRPKSAPSIKKVLCYEVLSETDWAAPFADSVFLPNVFVDISGTLETKLKAMSEYKLELKEFPHPRSLETITALAKMRGATTGVEAAEAFMLIREVCA
jgi:LmbE family N-acetylglucosaminyl deacetylase